MRRSPAAMFSDCRKRLAGKRKEDQELRISSCTTDGTPAVIIFNWDDTLCCTSSLVLEGEQQRSILPDFVVESSVVATRVGRFPPRLLRQMDDIVCRLVAEALRIGRTFIVTNSTVEWVWRTARAFLPGLLPLLDRVDVISARGSYGTSFPKEHGRWKDMAFLEIARQIDPSCRGDLLVIGNSDLEMHAADVAGARLKDWRLKVIKLRQKPSVQDLLVQQRIVLDNLVVFKETDKSVTVTLERSEASGNGPADNVGSDDTRAERTGILSL
mmetsp:Transcript_17187/g.45256  ORF Transcript_17187/g.45256 Transcript_17187/m.45256 type:complete len:270 (+) Transcript_17187:52-861(+)